MIYCVVHSIALAKHKQLIAQEGPNISYLRRYSTVGEIELDLPGDRHVCYESVNDNLKLNFSSTPLCAVPVKLCGSEFLIGLYVGQEQMP